MRYNFLFIERDGNENNCYVSAYSDPSCETPYNHGYPNPKEVSVPAGTALAALDIQSKSKGSTILDYDLDGMLGPSASASVCFETTSNEKEKIYVDFTCGVQLTKRAKKDRAKEKLLEIFDEAFMQ